MNQALLGKWLWQIEDDNVTLWKWVIMPKYVVKRNGWDIADPSPRRLGVWRGIAENKNLFNTNIYFRIESGERILF